MAKLKKVVTELAPPAMGPYSQAIAAPMQSARMVFVSGQIPVDLQTGRMISGDIRQMTAKVFDHIEAILNAEGGTLEDVVRVEVFLKDMNDFQAMNEEYKQRFKSGTLPARQNTIQAAKLPLDSPVEISCIAVL